MITNWKELTIRHLIQIQEIGELQLASDDEKNLMVAALLADIPYEQMLQMPLDDVRTYMDNAAFLLEEPKHEKTRKHYYVNGHKYKLFKNATEMTVAQYLDFQSVWKDGFDKRPAEMLSIFLVPDGHEYNDGYDKDEVMEDMYDLPVVEGLGICDFFTKRFVRLMRWGLMYCRLRMKWLRLTAKKENKELYKALEIQMNLVIRELECTYGSLASRQFPT